MESKGIGCTESTDRYIVSRLTYPCFGVGCDSSGERDSPWVRRVTAQDGLRGRVERHGVVAGDTVVVVWNQTVCIGITRDMLLLCNICCTALGDINSSCGHRLIKRLL